MLLQLKVLLYSNRKYNAEHINAYRILSGARMVYRAHGLANFTKPSSMAALIMLRYVTHKADGSKITPGIPRLCLNKFYT